MSQVTYTAIANDGFTFVFRFTDPTNVGFGLSKAVERKNDDGEWVPTPHRGSDHSESSLLRIAQLVLDDIDSEGGTDPSVAVTVSRNNGPKSSVVR